MKTHSNPPTAIPWEPSEDEIREHAYQLWLKNGQPEGRDLEHWFSAREALKQNASAHSAGSRPPHRRPHVTLKGAVGDSPRIVVDVAARKTPMPPVSTGVLPGTLVEH